MGESGGQQIENRIFIIERLPINGFSKVETLSKMFP